MNEPKKHHIVPESYLKLFADLKEELFRIKTNEIPQKIKNGILGSSSLKKFNVSQICYKEDFYKIQNNPTLGIHNITDEYQIEKESFKWYENNLELIIKNIRNRQTYLTLKDAEILCKGLLNIKIRNNHFRDNVIKNENMGEFLSKVFRKLPVTIQENKDAIEFIGKMKTDFDENPNLVNQLQNKSLLDNNNNDDRATNKVYDLCMNSQWNILEATINDMFITSDNPGFCVDENNVLENTKFGDLFTWYFPLNPLHCLRVNRSINETIKSLKPLNITDADSELVKMININTCRLANSDIYSSSRPTIIKNWIEFNKYKNSKNNN
jgi:Protein of unknown function (DUF4238)